jgi:hypothetical protein
MLTNHTTWWNISEDYTSCWYFAFVLISILDTKIQLLAMCVLLNHVFWLHSSNVYFLPECITNIHFNSVVKSIDTPRIPGSLSEPSGDGEAKRMVGSERSTCGNTFGSVYCQELSFPVRTWHDGRCILFTGITECILYIYIYPLRGHISCGWAKWSQRPLLASLLLRENHN